MQQARMHHLFCAVWRPKTDMLASSPASLPHLLFYSIQYPQFIVSCHLNSICEKAMKNCVCVKQRSVWDKNSEKQNDRRTSSLSIVIINNNGGIINQSIMFLFIIFILYLSIIIKGKKKTTRKKAKWAFALCRDGVSILRDDKITSAPSGAASNNLISIYNNGRGRRTDWW